MITQTISPQAKINSKKTNFRDISRPKYSKKIVSNTEVKTSTLSLELTPLNLQQLCLDIIKEIEERFKNDISIVFFFRGKKGNVSLDESLVMPILINLLDNAVKYSQGTKSKVYLDVIVKDKSVCFSIEDSGIGIPIADQSHLFEVFYRGKNVDNNEGSGIGLTVVKNCVNLHRGQIYWQSTLGQGSKFIISIPILSL